MNKGSRIYGNTWYTEWFSRHFYSSSGGVIPFLITRFLKNLGIETTIIHSADERAINNN